MYQKVFRFFVETLLAIFIWKDPSNALRNIVVSVIFCCCRNKTHLNVLAVCRLYTPTKCSVKKRSPTTAIHMIICGIKWCKKIAPCSLCVGVPYFAFPCFFVKACMGLGVCVCLLYAWWNCSSQKVATRPFHYYLFVVFR